MLVFYYSVYILSLILAVLTILAAICVAVIRPIFIRKLPKALRLFVTVCYIPVVIFIAISLIYFSILFFIYDSEALPIMLLINKINPYFFQIQLTFFVVLALERIAATVYIERYMVANNIWFFWVLTIFTVLSSVIFIAVLFNLIDDSPRNIFIVYTYCVFGMHLIALSVITVLYYLNQKMYKITAYQISLQKRCQIAENLKILANLFPLILIYTLLAPMGAVITLIRMYFELPRFPTSLLHVFNNLPHLIICIRLIYKNLKKSKNVDANNEIVVQNVLGKNLSTAVNSDTYFKELKQAWN